MKSQALLIVLTAVLALSACDRPNAPGASTQKDRTAATLPTPPVPGADGGATKQTERNAAVTGNRPGATQTDKANAAGG